MNQVLHLFCFLKVKSSEYLYNRFDEIKLKISLLLLLLFIAVHKRCKFTSFNKVGERNK